MKRKNSFYSPWPAFISRCWFETVVVNCRPVLIAGRLEASYPSSATLLALCVLLTVGKLPKNP